MTTLDNLRKAAKRWLKALRDGDADARARPVRAYPSAPEQATLEWATTEQKPNAVRVLTERGAGTRTRDDIQRAERVVTFLQSACWDHHVHGKGDHRMYDQAAQRILPQDPSIARDSIYTAIVCGDLQEVERFLAARPEAARFTHQPTIENALAIARLLLEHGAEPFDIQVLYNTHFSGDVLWWLELRLQAQRSTRRQQRGGIRTGRCSIWADTAPARGFCSRPR